MKISDLLTLLGGLALFLYGMQMMSGGLEAAAGNKMKTILERLTSNRFKGVLVGAVITAVIQSSSATTVMVVGFVNSGLMTLNQAIWVIMGANIGTTITGQLIALDISAIAPLFAIVGVVMIVFLKKEKAHHIGSIIAGIGVLFIGMKMMSNAMAPLQQAEGFISFMTNFSNPILGILAGAGFTAIIQSSSASIGILQALAGSGVIGLESAVFVLFGQNIGTCITAVLASIGTKTNAKRTTIIHLMFNIIGTVLFTILCLVTPIVKLIEYLTPDSVVAQIANIHTIFNIGTTLLLLPFGNLMAKAAIKILPTSVKEEEATHRLEYLTDLNYFQGHNIGQSAVSVTQIGQEVERMLGFVRENVVRSFDAVIKKGNVDMQIIHDKEEYIDYLNTQISKYISRFVRTELSKQDSLIVSGYYSIVGNVERLGDHTMNIAECAKNLYDKKLTLSSTAIKEIEKMKEISIKTLDEIRISKYDSAVIMVKTLKNEQDIDDMTDKYWENQIERIQEETCDPETGIIYSKMLTDFERIGDHALNIAQSYQKMKI